MIFHCIWMKKVPENLRSQYVCIYSLVSPFSLVISCTRMARNINWFSSCHRSQNKKKSHASFSQFWVVLLWHEGPVIFNDLLSNQNNEYINMFYLGTFKKPQKLNCRNTKYHSPKQKLSIKVRNIYSIHVNNMDLSEARQCLGKEKVSFIEQEIKCTQSSRIHSTWQNSNLWRNKCTCSSLPVQAGTWAFFAQRGFVGLLTLCSDRWN